MAAPALTPAISETHISTVAFIGDRAYKLLKPLRNDFLDYSTPAARMAAVEAELALNRRLSPDVYLGTADVVEQGAVVDRMLVMRRLPTDPRLAGLVHALLNDQSPEVRRAMAWQGVNMSDHPELRELFMRACDDPDDEVAQDALRGMGRLLGFDQAAQFYRHQLAAKNTESTAWGVYYGICNDLEEPAARALMQELTRSHFADVASSARDALESA